MPQAIFTLAKQAGKSDKEAEKLWKKAKKITIDTFGKENWDYTMGVYKQMLGINEAINPVDFVSSNKNAKEFIEQVVLKLLTKDLHRR